MRNLTLAIDERLLHEARRYALEHGTSVNQIVRDHLEALLRGDEHRERAAQRIRRHLADHPLRVGERTWSREDVNER